MNGKVKSYHANLLQRFHHQEDNKDTVNTVSGGAVWDLVSAVILEVKDCRVKETIMRMIFCSLDHTNRQKASGMCR